VSTRGGPIDESWGMVEEAVFRLCDELAANNPGDHVTLGPPLEELGWSDIETEYPVAVCELLFRAQGRALLNSDCLSTVMLTELAAVLDDPVDGILLPGFGPAPGSDAEHVTGILLGPLPGGARLVVPVANPNGAVAVGVVDADRLTGVRLDTFDASVLWTHVSGPAVGDLTEASTEWNRALAAAHRALATELVALGDQALRIAVDQVSTRIQFGSTIGSYQSPRHLLADASARLEGARALLGEAWSHGGEIPALAAKATAGRAHRAISDAAMQVCGAIGLTIEHDLHRYVARGFQVDSLCGSYQQLEALLAERLFGNHSSANALPAVVSWAK
jgi:hypothetical protein